MVVVVVVQVLLVAIRVYASKHRERPDRLIEQIVDDHRWGGGSGCGVQNEMQQCNDTTRQQDNNAMK